MSSTPAAIRVSDPSVSSTTCYLTARSAFGVVRFGDALAAVVADSGAQELPRLHLGGASWQVGRGSGLVEQR
jgi:hypothetical protein